ncbi:MAG TPA: hypothetical protein VNZ86_19785, partial [Bacteroidia bacterium]|nr:hypothetical protein [Bacteroidia bacterium]
MKLNYSIILLLIMISNPAWRAQGGSEVGIPEADKSALEGIIVEKYYVSDTTDQKDSLGGFLEAGSTTYRIYVDLKPGYTLQVVYGTEKHELRIQTSTRFYNNTQCGALIGYNVNSKKINTGNYALDTWITINSASNNHAGILINEDKDGSILNKKAFTRADGLTNGNLPVIKPFNINFSCFKDGSNATLFSTRNGGWAAISGIVSGAKGPTEENKILIAQLTTTGKLTFE